MSGGSVWWEWHEHVCLMGMIFIWKFSRKIAWKLVLDWMTNFFYNFENWALPVGGSTRQRVN